MNTVTALSAVLGAFVHVLQQTCMVLHVVMRVSFKGQTWRTVAGSHQEDDDGAKDHHRSDQEEAETVDGASDATPVIFLL